MPTRPILDTWTAHEAYAVAGFIDHLAEILWVHHEQVIRINGLHQNSPAQWARAVVSFLECLSENVWSRYGPAIARDCFCQPSAPPVDQQLPLPFPGHRDLDIPF